jgi:hypothetical protein
MEVRCTIPDDDHRRIKAAAALADLTLAEYVAQAAAKQARADLNAARDPAPVEAFLSGGPHEQETT